MFTSPFLARRRRAQRLTSPLLRALLLLLPPLAWPVRRPPYVLYVKTRVPP